MSPDDGRSRGRSRLPSRSSRPVMITGGAGFIGTNLAHRLAQEGHRVLIYDSLARPGVAANLDWLRAEHGDAVTVTTADVRDPDTLRHAVAQAECVYHLAAQVAVTTSLIDPVEDFQVNAAGTLNLLAALRAVPTPPPLVFTSTNKVYGRLRGLPLQSVGERTVPADPVIARTGVAENQPLDFASPYGCSKGSADQYVLDHARTYGLPATVLRMSCIYGPHQFGTEDQGWVAHFLRRALADAPITLYGDGRQVRDILYVGDLVDALLLARSHIDALSGEAFNIGGGPANALSLRELLARIARIIGRPPAVGHGPWRPGDQAWYVADSRKFQAWTGWRPQVGITEGLACLHRWLIEARPTVPVAAP